MAVLAADKQRPVRMPAGGITTRKLKLAGGTAEEVYKGSAMWSDVSANDGYFLPVPLTSGTNAASGDVFGGIAAEAKSVLAADSDGDKVVTAYVSGVWGFAVGSVVITEIGAPMYLSDDTTVTATSTNNLWCGILIDVDATYAWVDIAGAVGRTNTAT